MSEYADWKGWDPADFGHCPATAQRYFRWHVNRAFAGAVPDRAKVLEIGFGNGRFLGFCRSQGFSVTAVDVDPELVARAARAGFRAAADLRGIEPKEQFDLVVAFDVLEHMERTEVEEFFRVLPQLLSNDGRVLIRVPNGDSPFGRRHQHGDLGHVNTFGEFKLKQLARTHGLAVHAVGESPWNVDEFEDFHFALWVRGMVRKLLDYVLSQAYHRQPLDLAPNLVVVLRKP